MPVRSPKPIVRLILDGTAVRVWLDRIHRVDPGVRPRFASVYFFLPPAHRGGRVIDTDALRILLLSREPSDGQERNPDNEDNPNMRIRAALPQVWCPPIQTNQTRRGWRKRQAVTNRSAIGSQEGRTTPVRV